MGRGQGGHRAGAVAQRRTRDAVAAGAAAAAPVAGARVAARNAGPLEIGATFGTRYRIDALLGFGGMGATLWGLASLTTPLGRSSPSLTFSILRSRSGSMASRRSRYSS